MNSHDLVGLRVMAVHAHPDDEALWTGGLLAKLAARGAQVTVVTCTLGENGEVIGEPLQGMTADNANMLGGFRYGELADSLRILGANAPSHQPILLGGVGAFRDSGMAGTPPADHPHAFVQAGKRAERALKEQVLRLQPHVLVTYAPDGGYGHPDHIMAHQITHRVVEELGGCEGIEFPDSSGTDDHGADFLPTLTRRLHGSPSSATAENQWQRPWAVIWPVVGESTIKRGLDLMKAIPAGWTRPRGMEFTFGQLGDREATRSAMRRLDTNESASGQPEVASGVEISFVPDSVVDFTVELDEHDYSAKREAMGAHPTQLWIADGRMTHTNPEPAWGFVDDPIGRAVFALSNLIAQPLAAVEQYVIGEGGSRRALDEEFISTVPGFTPGAR